MSRSTSHRKRSDSPLIIASLWRVLPGVTGLVLLMGFGACGEGETFLAPLTEEESRPIMAELQDRSFRQFDPSRDGNPRRGVILDFLGDRVGLWAQFAADGRAIHEWEIVSEDFQLQGNPDGSQVRILFNQATAEQHLPSGCDDCIDWAGMSISVKDVFEPDRISFKLADPRGALPLPFPVFESWTDFQEDEYFE